MWDLNRGELAWRNSWYHLCNFSIDLKLLQSNSLKKKKKDLAFHFWFFWLPVLAIPIPLLLSSHQKDTKSSSGFLTLPGLRKALDQRGSDREVQHLVTLERMPWHYLDTKTVLSSARVYDMILAFRWLSKYLVEFEATGGKKGRCMMSTEFRPCVWHCAGPSSLGTTLESHKNPLDSPSGRCCSHLQSRFPSSKRRVAPPPFLVDTKFLDTLPLSLHGHPRWPTSHDAFVPSSPRGWVGDIFEGEALRLEPAFVSRSDVGWPWRVPMTWTWRSLGEWHLFLTCHEACLFLPRLNLLFRELRVRCCLLQRNALRHCEPSLWKLLWSGGSFPLTWKSHHLPLRGVPAASADSDLPYPGKGIPTSLSLSFF